MIKEKNEPSKEEREQILAFDCINLLFLTNF